MRQCSAMVLVIGLLAAVPAAADEFEEGGTLYAIQNRKHVMGHEFTLAIGTSTVWNFASWMFFSITRFEPFSCTTRSSLGRLYAAVCTP